MKEVKRYLAVNSLLTRMESVRRKLEADLKLAEVNNDLEAIQERGLRLLAAQKMYQKLFDLFEASKPNSGFSVFISYSSSLEKAPHFKILSAMFAEMNIQHQFMSDGHSHSEQIRTDTLAKIAASSSCLIVMTPRDYKKGKEYAKDSVMPSSWILEEKGIAVALRKQIAIIAHEAICSDCIYSITADYKHFPFRDERSFDNLSDFRHLLRSAISHLRQVHAANRIEDLQHHLR